MKEKETKKRGRPKNKPVSEKIHDALGAAQDEIEKYEATEVEPAESKELVPVAPKKAEVATVPKRDLKDASDDYDFARANLHKLLAKGSDILDGITQLAQDSESARNYEVAGNVLKTLIEGTRELMTLQKDIRDVEGLSVNKDEKPGGSSVNIGNAETVNNNTMIVEATTMEMLEIIQRAKKQEIYEKSQIEEV